MMIYVITLGLIIIFGLLLSILARMTEQKIEERSNRDEILNSIRILSSKVETSERRVTEQIVSLKNKSIETFQSCIRDFKENELLEITNSLRTLVKQIYVKSVESVSESKEISIGVSCSAGTTGVVGTPSVENFIFSDVWVKEYDNVTTKDNESSEQDNTQSTLFVPVENSYSLEYFDNGFYVKKNSKDKGLYDSYHVRFSPDQFVPNLETFSKWYQEYFDANFDGSDESFDSLILS